MTDLPIGLVTLLFTDIEGSTRLLDELGSQKYAAALAAHRRAIRDAISANGGVEMGTEGDAFFIAFGRAENALRAAWAAQDALATGPIRVRMGIHTGWPLVTDEGYVGPDVHMGARVGAAGHGGQVLITAATMAEVSDDFGLEMIDLGEHRVKDFAAPVWIYQLGNLQFPPLRTISNTNLPRPASSFVGRNEQVASLVGRINGGARLVTLIGPGGSGKTRLAIEAASELVPEFPNGVFWVPLAALRDYSLVTSEIGRTLGARGDLADFVRDRRMLLVIDNLEQVIAAAADLSTVLSACPNLHLLVTSREQLRVSGELAYPVEPLPANEAIELFTTRSGLAPSETIADLCARLDNLPLAVELAAARTGVMTPPQILNRLSARLDVLKGGRDADPRQQTLRATIAWSYDLLSPTEKTLLARLGVFRGGWSLEAAESIADAEIDDLQALTDKSLVTHDGDRFAMLETIREFALERLEQSGEANEMRRRHAQHFLDLAEELEPQQRGNPRRAFDVLEVEHDNVRAAFDRLVAAGEGESALRLCIALWRMWTQRGYFIEGRHRFETALAMVPDRSSVRARGLLAAAPQAQMAGDNDAHRAFATEGLAIAQEIGDAWGIAYGKFAIANADSESDELARALPMLEQAIVDFQRAGDDHQALVAMTNAAAISGMLGDQVGEWTLNAQALELARRTGNVRVEARALQGLAQNGIRAGDFAAAAALLAESLRLFDKLGEVAEVLATLAIGSLCLARSGHTESAAPLLFMAEGEMERREIVDPALVEPIAETRSLLNGALNDDAFRHARAQAASLGLGDAVELALAEFAKYEPN